MKAAAASLFILLANAAHAADAALLREAQQALAESIPQVAIHKLRTYLAAQDLTAEDRAAAGQQLSEALLAAGQQGEALSVLEAPEVSAGGSALLLRADVLASAGRWGEALPLYQSARREAAAPASAWIGEAESLRGLGRTAEAVQVLEELSRIGRAPNAALLRLATFLLELRQLQRAEALLAAVKPATPAEEKWHDYAEGRLLLLQERADPALAKFRRVLLDEAHLSDGLRVAATIGHAEAMLMRRGVEAAHKLLETFIWRNPDSAHLDLAFRRLDQLYAMQERPDEDELHKWAAKPAGERAMLARFYVARLQLRKKKQDKAAASLAAFVEMADQALEEHPDSSPHHLLPYAHLMRADLLLARRNYREALSALDAAARYASTEELRADVELRTALVYFRQREYLLAANTFKRAGQRSPRLRESATFDAALATLNQRNFERFMDEFRAFQEQFPESPLGSELILEQGLVQARFEDGGAIETLQQFAARNPRHPRAAEAQLALAEIALNEGRAGDAAHYLQVANSSAPARDVGEHGEYLAIFLAAAETPRDDSKVIALAQAFIRTRSASKLIPEVRMKLGEVFFDRGSFADAETQFATLAQDFPEGPYAETALFLAGQAAMQSINPEAVDRALQLFDQVVKRDRSLKLHARQQQAIVQTRLGRESEAIKLYDLILASQPPPVAELRHAALCAKGDNLLALGKSDREQRTAALATYRQLATLPDVPAVWRNQALYKMARQLAEDWRRMAGAPAKAAQAEAAFGEATATFYDVLNVDPSKEREFFWYYKAGFDAAQLFEEQAARSGAAATEAQAHWRAAIGIYQKMAQLEGPRSAEAQTRMRQLQLKHFIWD